eukprot:m.26664 g.26664  ORF g.26664 m.26664 type:complete len:156 (-) comp7821_c0_seq2:14-481(-)
MHSLGNFCSLTKDGSVFPEASVLARNTENITSPSRFRCASLSATLRYSLASFPKLPPTTFHLESSCPFFFEFNLIEDRAPKTLMFLEFGDESMIYCFGKMIIHWNSISRNHFFHLQSMLINEFDFHLCRSGESDSCKTTQRCCTKLHAKTHHKLQ